MRHLELALQLLLAPLQLGALTARRRQLLLRGGDARVRLAVLDARLVERVPQTLRLLHRRLRVAARAVDLGGVSRRLRFELSDRGTCSIEFEPQLLLARRRRNLRGGRL